MSGERQHYIPRFLQRGFLAATRKGEKIWIFPGLDAPRLQAIEKVALQRHFYSRPASGGVATLDDVITTLEDRIGALTNGMRNGPIGPVDAAVAAEVVSHLSSRNAHLRNSLAHGAREIASAAYKVFGNEVGARKVLGLDGGRMPEKFAEQVTPHLAKDPRFAAFGLPPQVLTRMAFGIGRENFSSAYREERPKFVGALAYMYREADTVARDGHTKALSTIDQPTERTTALEELEWQVIASETPLVLPDCVALTGRAGGEFQPLMIAARAEMAVVAMPLTAHRLLLARGAGVPKPNLATFNSQAAACSRDFFLSDRHTPEIAALAALIGSRLHATVERPIRDAIQELAAPSLELADATAGGLISDRSPPPGPPENYPLQFLDCADDDRARLISNAVGDIVNAFGESMPLRRLDGFTFASDFAGALRDLDRGMDLPPLVPSIEVFGNAIAMAPVVFRNDTPMVRVVMQAAFADALLSDDDEARALAIHAIAFELGHVACIEFLDEALPGALLEPAATYTEARLFPPAQTAWTSYFAARTSATFGRDAGEDYRFLFLSALAEVQTQLPAERLNYRFHGDVPRLTEFALRKIETMLTFAAELVGHYDGVDQAIEDDEGTLAEALKAAGLAAWFDLFHGDLQSLWERRGRWQTRDEFMSLCLHVERIFWAHAMFPWEAPEGGMWLSIPSASDQMRIPGEAMRRAWRRVRGAVSAPLRWLAIRLK